MKDGKPQAGELVEFTLIDPVTRAPTGAIYTAVTGADCKATVQIPAGAGEDIKTISAALVKGNKRLTGFFMAQSSDTIQWSTDQLQLAVVPVARVRVNTRVRLQATYVVGKERKANSPVTFTIEYSDGTKETRTVNTNERGVANLLLVRDAVSVASVVASVRAGSGKTVTSKSVGAGAAGNAAKSVIEWFDDGPAVVSLLQLSPPSSRVQAGTAVPLTARYTENGKPVAGRRIVFVVQYKDGTRTELVGTTNADGQATVSVIRDAAGIADITATTTSTGNSPVNSSGKSTIEWTAAATPAMCMSFLIGRTLPISALSCATIARDKLDAQLATTIAGDLVRQSAALGDSSLKAGNVRVTITSCTDQVRAALAAVARLQRVLAIAVLVFA
jgi:hypothetical protein